jgi:hypothetical protein
VKIRSGKCRHVVVGMALFVVLAISPGTVAAKQIERSPSFRVNSGFLPQRDGFSFANWASNPQRGTGIQLLIQLFGRASICTNVSTNDPCIPLQSAEQFAVQVEDQLATGRCEGLTVLAAKIHAEGGTPASLVTAADASTNIDYWWATQMLPSVAAKSRLSRSLKPSQLINEIRQGVVRGATSTLGMYFQNEGHSVLPISIEKRGRKVVVGVYDSNTPEVTQTLVIDTKTQVWVYSPVDKTGKVLFTWRHKGAGALDVIPLALRTPQETRYFSLSSITE